MMYRFLLRNPRHPGLQRAGLMCRGKHDGAAAFQFKRVIVAPQETINKEFAQNSLRINAPAEPINVEKARQQHMVLVRELKKLIPEVLEVPCDSQFPDQVYVEEPAVIVNGNALLTQMKPVSRAGEIEPMRIVLEKMGVNIHQMSESGAYLDGGDVLFTGREFLVGLTERTNSAGIAELARIFPDWKVTGIKIQKGVLHLKSLCSIAGIDTIAVSDTQAGRLAWKDIETQASYKYDKLVFPDNNGANCLFMNGVVLHTPKEEYPESGLVWEQLNCPKIAIPNSEFDKSDGSLTCRVVRVFEF